MGQAYSLGHITGVEEGRMGKRVSGIHELIGTKLRAFLSRLSTSGEPRSKELELGRRISNIRTVAS